MTFFEPKKYGTYMSYVLTLASIILSVVLQIYFADEVSRNNWSNGCKAENLSECEGYQIVFRISFALVSFFVMHGIVLIFSPSIFDKMWPLKYLGYFILLFAYYFCPPNMFDDRGYAWVARICGAIFLVFQQVILLDIAYTWNEKWCENASDTDNGEFNKWTAGLIFASLFIFSVSLTGIGLLYWQFSGCSDNNAIITFTLLFTIISTIIQIFFSSQGSLLTSSVMSLYGTFICFSAISLNPLSHCNPILTTDSSTTLFVQIVGTILTVLSLSWTTYSAISSYTNDVSSKSVKNKTESNVSLLEKNEIVDDDNNYSAQTVNLILEVTLIFILVSMYYGMVLTNWATFQRHTDSPDPKAGNAAMWMQAMGQWVAFCLYIFSLVAPTLFPDRDFGLNV